MNAQDQPLLITLVAVQFLVHALGWAMAARLFQGWRAPQGQFAGFWLALALGLMMFVPALHSGHLLRNLGSVLVVAAAALQHRGLAQHWGRPKADRAYAALLALLALALLLRVGQALASNGVNKLSIDAPEQSNVALVILVMFVGGCMNLAQIRFVLGRVLQRLTAQARTDALTGTSNRRGLLHSLNDMHARAQRGGHAYSVLMVDVDHFKTVNDRHGHAVGDRVLQRVAQGLRDGLRSGDVVARWGGEEFCVLLPRIGAVDAQALAERMAQQIAAQGEPRVTVSIGVAEVELTGEVPEKLICRADAALYQAKALGRHRVVVAARVQTN